MDPKKADILIQNINKIIQRFELNSTFWDELHKSNIFPNEYIEYMKREITETDENKKKNLIIDLKRRESISYEKFSNILRNLYKCDILDQYIKCLSNNAYPIVSDKPGICLIINNKQFFDCDPREGSEKDVEMFRSLFEGLNYEVIVRENMGQKQLLDLLREKSADEELKKHDIFIAIIMSHGISEHVITSDSEYVSYDEIIDFFSNEQCKHLVGKPKVFIFNCCRSQNERTASLRNTRTIQKQSFGDILMIFSTLNYYLSVRDEESGTLFAKAFTTAMANNPNEDVCTIVTKANNILEELVRNDPNNRIETRQTIEQKKWGHKKNFYFSKWKH